MLILLWVAVLALSALWFIGRFAVAMYRNNQARKAEAAFQQKLEQYLPTLRDFTPNGVSMLRADTALAIDIARKKLCIIRAAADSSLHAKVWRREQILGADLIENKQSVRRTSTDRGSQLMAASVGNILFGRTGVLVGGLAGDKLSRSEEEVYQLDLAVVVEDMAEPLQLVSFLAAGESCAKNSQHYRDASHIANQWHLRLSQLMKSG